jgi:peptide methionine sulfoxide reductase msrA/msrB
MLLKIFLSLGICLIFVLVISYAGENKNMLDKNPEKEKVNKFGRPALTEKEKKVIEQKGTEPAFTGKYWNNHADGTYNCRKCGQKLFESNAKFDSKTGWPSFDDAVQGAIKRIPDKDGIRTEIVCSRCNAHLGHVFLSERFTDKNTRYCVNSVSLEFCEKNAKTADLPKKTETAIFAGGCFWGVEYYFNNEKGVISANSGYTGGDVASPSYKQVCSGNTGHAEAVKILFDPEKTSFETLCRLFFEIHDPTQLNRQGPDIGEQYRSEIFYKNEAQRKVAKKLISQLKKNGHNVKTKLTPASKFWKAEEYHQDYYEKSSKTPYCHIRIKRFNE